MNKIILTALIAVAGFTGCRSAQAACYKAPPDKTVHSVPDAGSTLALLSLGTVAVAAFRRRVS